jgi:hypothetical protein
VYHTTLYRCQVEYLSLSLFLSVCLFGKCCTIYPLEFLRKQLTPSHSLLLTLFPSITCCLKQFHSSLEILSLCCTLVTSLSLSQSQLLSYTSLSTTSFSTFIILFSYSLSFSSSNFLILALNLFSLNLPSDQHRV